ncbi:hypothetical protein EGT07_26280 [Herbaspirillum sp. HC18]|nr:hypothetical protein EGT07_26280 [Herbaspirillum sp. HC18]
MKIKKIRLKNGYKRFHDLTIDLGDHPKRIVALVGPNGCGKSSVLDGMLFHSGAWQPLGDKGRKDHEYHSMNRSPNYDHTNVTIEFVEGTYDSIRDMKRKDGKEITIFSFRSPYRYNSRLKISEAKAVSEIRLNDYGASTASDIDDKMEQNYRRLYIKYNKYLNEVDCKPSEAKKKIIADLNLSIKECLDLEISSIGEIEASRGTLYFTKKDHPAEFDFNVLSSGEKEVVDILLDLYLRQDEYCDSVFLMDEPELHINTSIQRKLLIEINRLIGTNCQLWLTTHSIGFLRALQDEFKNDCQIIRFEASADYASTPQTLLPIKKTISVWRELFDVALDDLARLVSPKQIIYCEGRDKPGRDGIERGFDAIVFNTIFGEKYPQTLFVSSGGNTELDQRSGIAIAIMSKVFSSLEILVLKDRDMASGKFTTENDRQIYLNKNPQHHRVMKRWEIENYLFDKKILQKYCDARGLSFNEQGYDNFVKDIFDDNVKDTANTIKGFCGVSEHSNTERFKIDLSEYITSDTEVFQELEKCIFSRG